MCRSVPGRKRVRTYQEPSDGDEMRSQLYSPSAAIRPSSNFAWLGGFGVQGTAGVHIRNPACPTEPAVTVELQSSFSPQTQAALGSRICLMDKPSSSCSALPGRAQPPRPDCTAAALSGQGHQGDTQCLFYAAAGQAKAGYSFSFPLVTSTNLAIRVILFRLAFPA